MTLPLELIDLAPVLFVRNNRDGVLLEVRGAWARVLGWAPEALVGRNFASLVHPEDLERTLARHDEAFGAGAPVAPFELRLRAHDGSYRWISWSSSPPTDGVAVAFGIDVTARRQELELLEQMRGELRSVLETVPFYITRIDRSGTVEFINRTYPGVTPDQVIGMNLLDWLPPDHRKPMRDAWERVLAGEDLVELVVEGNGEHGSAWYRSRLGPVLKGGNVVGVVIAGEDITALRHAEQRASQASRLEAIGRVAGAIAHDVNNMLSVMVSELELLDMELPEASAAVRESLDGLSEAVHGATQITRGLADAVRQKPTADGRLNLVTGVRELETMLKLAAGKSLELRLTFGVERADVDLARHELQQVLINLVVNCREAQSVKHVDIVVDTVQIGPRSGSWLPPGSYGRVTVRDDGPGIPEAIRARVLEPFVTTKEFGTGFGLATCFALANARGGSFEVASPQEGGTVVTLLLPLRDPSGMPSFPPQPEPDWPTPASQLTVLVVDDNDRVRANVARYLARVGHRVLQARDGEDALDVLGRHVSDVDVVVTDLLMPNCDGLEMARRLRGEGSSVPLIVISGYITAEQQRELASLDATVMTKPIAPSRLLEALQRYRPGGPSAGGT